MSKGNRNDERYYLKKDGESQEEVCDTRYSQEGAFQRWVIKKLEKLETDFADLVDILTGGDDEKK